MTWYKKQTDNTIAEVEDEEVEENYRNTIILL